MIPIEELRMGSIVDYENVACAVDTVTPDQLVVTALNHDWGLDPATPETVNPIEITASFLKANGWTLSTDKRYVYEFVYGRMMLRYHINSHVLQIACESRWFDWIRPVRYVHELQNWFIDAAIRHVKFHFKAGYFAGNERQSQSSSPD